MLRSVPSRGQKDLCALRFPSMVMSVWVPSELEYVNPGYPVDCADGGERRFGAWEEESGWGDSSPFPFPNGVTGEASRFGRSGLRLAGCALFAPVLIW